MTTGEGIDTTSRKLSKQMGGSFYNAKRIIRTETIATYTKASLDSYAQLGIKDVRIIKEKDACPVCKGKDDILPMERVTISTTAPPFHPQCRCCVAPIVKD
jgi:SPP1 gp7 family putative phage head morphogenesis protein